MTDLPPQEHHAHHVFRDEMDAQHRRDTEQLAKFGYDQDLRRSLGFFSTFAIAFSFILATDGLSRRPRPGPWRPWQPARPAR